MAVLQSILSLLMSIFSAISGVAGGTIEIPPIEKPQTEIVEEAETPAETETPAEEEHTKPSDSGKIPGGAAEIADAIAGLVDGIRDRVGN